MAEPKRPNTFVFNESMLRAFINGTLEPAVEEKIAKLLDAQPELLEKISSSSGDAFLERLRRVQHYSAERSQVRAKTDIVEPGSVETSAAMRDFATPAALADYSGYTIIKELGRGGMGVVYLARNIRMDRLEVLKVLNERLLDHGGAKERFLREIRAVSKLSHTNIVTSYSILPLDDQLVFVMEYVDGTDLQHYILENKPLAVATCCSLAKQLAMGLQHAHSRGLVHRDIKPSNAIVYEADKQLQVKILDFGLAKATSEKKLADLTQTGTMLGTPAYMSPEQTLDAAKADIRADIYSLGCTLYHMLTGDPPFTGTHSAILLAQMQREPVSLELVRPDVPIDLAAVVAKMMAKSPGKRYQTPAEVADALTPFLHEQVHPSYAIEIGSFQSPVVSEQGQNAGDTSVEQARTQSSFVAPATLLRSTPRRFVPLAWACGLFVLVVALWQFGKVFSTTANGTILVENLPADTEAIVDGKSTEIVGKASKDSATVKPRRLSDVVDRTVAITLLNDEFANPDKSGFAFGGHRNKFRDGRYVVNGPYQGAWGNTSHRFTDFACELVGRTTGANHKGWGVAVFKKFDPGSPLEVLRGFEVLLDSEGRLFVVPCRWVENKDKDIEDIGPLQVPSFQQGEFNSLVLVLQKGTKLSLFVNEIEVCQEIELPYELIPANIQLASVGGYDQTSRLELERIKVCSMTERISR